MNLNSIALELKIDCLLLHNVESTKGMADEKEELYKQQVGRVIQTKTAIHTGSSPSHLILGQSAAAAAAAVLSWLARG